MPIKESTKKNIEPKQLDDLWKAIGWKPRGRERWKDALSKSAFVYSLWDGIDLIGLGRIMEDGVMCMFYDIAVHPKYQGKGYGKRIMEKLIFQVKGKKYVSIGLFAWEGNPKSIPFYESFGFEKTESGMELKEYMVTE